MSKNVYSITRRVNTNLNEIVNRPLNWVKRRCKPTITNDWRIDLINELLLCRDGTLECNLSGMEIADLLNDVCTM